MQSRIEVEAQQYQNEQQQQANSQPTRQTPLQFLTTVAAQNPAALQDTHPFAPLFSSPKGSMMEEGMTRGENLQREISNFFTGFKESNEFYNGLGYPQFAGLYEPFEIPSGYKVTNITETPQGLSYLLEGTNPDPQPEQVAPSPTPTETPLPTPSPSRASIPTPQEVGGVPNISAMASALGDKFIFNLTTPEAMKPIVNAQQTFQEMQKAKQDPLGYYGGKILRDVGLISMAVNPAGIIPAAILGSGISEGINLAATGNSLSPAELITAGLDSAAFMGISNAILGVGAEVAPAVGKALSPAFRAAGQAGTNLARDLGLTTTPIWQGMKTEIAPVFGDIARRAAPYLGRAAVTSGVGGATGFILSGGDTGEAEKQAAIAGLMSLGSDIILPRAIKAGKKGYNLMKEFLGSDSTTIHGVPSQTLPEMEIITDPEVGKVLQKTTGLNTVFKDLKQENLFEGLSTDLQTELKARYAKASDPLYELLHPTDEAEIARMSEQRWGSKRQAIFSQADLDASLKTSMPDMMSLDEALFPEKVQAARIKGAEAKYGSTAVADILGDIEPSKVINKWGFAEQPAPKGTLSSLLDLEAPPRAYNSAAARNWAIKAVKEGLPQIPNWEEEAAILGKYRGFSKLSKLEADSALFSGESVPAQIPDTLDALGIRQRKWTIRAAKANPANFVTDLDLELNLLQKNPQLSKASIDKVFSDEFVPYKNVVTEELPQIPELDNKTMKWTNRALGKDSPYYGLKKTPAAYIKEFIAKELPKTSGEGGIVTSGGQQLIVLQKPEVEVKTTTQAKTTTATTKQPLMVNPILKELQQGTKEQTKTSNKMVQGIGSLFDVSPQQKTQQKGRQQSGVAALVFQGMIPTLTPKPAQNQKQKHNQQSSLVNDIVGTTSVLDVPQMPKQDTAQKPKQDVAQIFNQAQRQQLRQLQQFNKPHENYRKRRKQRKSLSEAQKILNFKILPAKKIPAFIEMGLPRAGNKMPNMASVILEQKPKRTRGRRTGKR